MEKDGTLKFNAFNIKTLIYYCVWSVGTGLFLWRYTIQKLMNQSEMFVLDYTMIVLNHYPIILSGLGPCGVFALGNFENWSLNSKSINFDSKIAFMVVCLVLDLVYVLGQMFNSIGYNDAILWAAMTLLLGPYLMTAIGEFTSPRVCIAMLKSELTTLKNQKVSKKDIEDAIEKIEAVSKYVAIPMFSALSISQVTIILSIFLPILDLKYINFIIMASVIVLTLLMNFGDIEECYDLIKTLANKARVDACNNKSVKEMMIIMVAAGKLEDTCPFTAMKFFTLERSTVTAMLANTLTYLVVLYQTFASG